MGHGSVSSRGFLFGSFIYPKEHYNPILSFIMTFIVSTSCCLVRKTLKTYILSLKAPSSGENNLVFPINFINFCKTVSYFKCIKTKLVKNNFNTLKLRQNQFPLISKKNWGSPYKRGHGSVSSRAINMEFCL